MKMKAMLVFHFMQCGDGTKSSLMIDPFVYTACILVCRQLMGKSRREGKRVYGFGRIECEGSFNSKSIEICPHLRRPQRRQRMKNRTQHLYSIIIMMQA